MSLSMPVLRAIGLSLLLLTAAPQARADLVSVSGSYAGDMTFEWVGDFRVTGAYALFSLPTPTFSSRTNRSNYMLPLDWAYEVYGDGFAPATFHLTVDPYGQINSIGFVQVDNPHPGIGYNFHIYYTGEAWAGLDAFGLRGDIPNFGYNTTSFTHPGTFIDAGSTTIQTAVNQALNDVRWKTEVLAGNRGDLECVSLDMTDLTYNSTTNNSSSTLASTVWSQQFGDCDDFVKLETAMLRRRGIPARVCVAVSYGEGPTPLTSPTYERTFHATGEYWNGSEWESFEPHASVNFAYSDNFILGTDVDFDFLYPQRWQSAPFSPVQWLGSSFTNALTEYSGGGSVRGVSYREINTNVDISTLDVQGSSYVTEDPFDVGESTGSLLGVIDSPVRRYDLQMSIASPSTDGIAITFGPTWSGPCRVRILDIQGRVLRESAVNIDASRVAAMPRAGLTSGLYFVEVSSGVGRVAGKCVLL